jgi:polysaccharide biosynthesis transport protein
VFRTSQQVVSNLDVECLALIPQIKNADSENFLPRHQGVVSRKVERIIQSKSRMLRAILEEPLSRYAESLRSVRLAVDLSNGGSKSKNIVGVTSAFPGEGKSTIAAGLAALVALAGRRVILVDCDLRDPSLSRSFASEANVGLLEVASGKAILENAIWTDPQTNLEFLPVVGTDKLKNTSDFFAAESTKKFFDFLQSRYECVIVDFSPLAPIVDVRAAWRLINSYILVIEWGRTKVDMVRHALNNAPSLHENIIGAVLNKVDMRVIGKYERKDAKYLRNNYFARYGYEK